MLAKGISNTIASKIVGILTTATTIISFYANPGLTIFKLLDAGDKYPKNKYYNGK